MKSKAKPLQDNFKIFNDTLNSNKKVIALAGNPNTGKSTIFNSLTGMNQHTGNWPGKTVTNARGSFTHKETTYMLVDVPGTYSLFASSVDEECARDYLCFGKTDAIIVVADATCLERNLNLVFQVMELKTKVILVVNLIDEATKKGIKINRLGLEYSLGIPVIFTAAKKRLGLSELKEVLHLVANDNYPFQSKKIMYSSNLEEKVTRIQRMLEGSITSVNTRWLALRIIDGDHLFFNSIRSYFNEKELNLINELRTTVNVAQEEVRTLINEINFQEAEKIKEKYVTESITKYRRDQLIDDVITSKKWGVPLMMLMLGIILFITITGANIPSMMLSSFFFKIENYLRLSFLISKWPPWLSSLLIEGVYQTVSTVISVMLPPMAIFFPLFTFLEDLGYLPRVAYNLDHLFKKAGAHGKQCLSMCMGFGCNAAGVIGTRIIDSPREKLIAIVTNNFVPCNGRFPALIAISSVFFTISVAGIGIFIPALMVTSLIILGILATLFVSLLLSKTLLKGVPSTFTLELPPYRKPSIGRIIYTSIINRTIFVLSRAMVVAIPAGVIIWLAANIKLGSSNIFVEVSNFLNPFGKALGLDGFILLAFILAFPANEIVIPILLMAYVSSGAMVNYESISSLREVLINNGWTILTAINFLLFTLFHWPCSTTILTIKKETGSIKWTLIGLIVPTLFGIIICLSSTALYNLLF